MRNSHKWEEQRPYQICEQSIYKDGRHSWAVTLYIDDFAKAVCSTDGSVQLKHCQKCDVYVLANFPGVDDLWLKKVKQ